MNRTLLCLLLLASSCLAPPPRDCNAHREGTYTFTTEIDGATAVTRFTRTGDREIETFEGRTDTSSVRWLNDCEYVLRKLSPRNRSEEQSVHIKILSTTDSTYTFEYNVVGSSVKLRGTAIKQH